MTKFSDLKLDPKVLQAVAEAGYETPTPIQAGAIPPALEGRDVLGIAQTGTGKTAGFVLPMITLLGRGRARARMPRSLVLCPTRELAAQVAENFDTYAKHTRLTKALLIGGVSFNEQDKLIDRGVDVLIATPGRLLDHFERGKLLLTGVQIMVVDEADRMLDMGFIPDIERIFQLTPFTRQTLFFSATMAPEIERITNTFLNAPERIEVARQATTSETITQKLIELTPTRKDQSAKQKRELLRALIDAEGEALKNAIIFCNRKTEVDIVAKSLKAHGYDAAPIHGDLDQRQRTATLDGFREGTLRFLIASDVAARGLDIPAVSHVINFDLPSHAEDYVHRIGRTGRAGRQGTAISIATPADDKYLSAIENLVKQTLPRTPRPEGFSLSDAAQSAPRPASERGGRGTSRTRVRKGADRAERAAPAPDEQALETPASEPARNERRRPPRAEDRRPSSSEALPEPRPGHAPEPRPGPRPEQRDEQAGEARRRDSGHDRARENGRDRHRDRGAPVTGMGDHVPDFMLTSFRPALAATAARIAAAEAADATPAAEAPATANARPAPAAKPAPVKATAPAAKPAPAEAAAPAETAVPAPGPAAEAPAEPAKPKRSRTRSRKKADATAATPAGAESAAEATETASQEGKDGAAPAPAADARPAEDKGGNTPAASEESGAAIPDADGRPGQVGAPAADSAASSAPEAGTDREPAPAGAGDMPGGDSAASPAPADPVPAERTVDESADPAAHSAPADESGAARPDGGPDAPQPDAP